MIPLLLVTTLAHSQSAPDAPDPTALLAEMAPYRAQLHATLRDRPAPLALYCFARDREFVDTLLAAVPSGSVGINDCGKQASNLDLPFGGVGESGHGRYRGKSGIEAFSYQRAVTTRFFLPDPFEMLPPREKMAKFLMKWMK